MFLTAYISPYFPQFLSLLPSHNYFYACMCCISLGDLNKLIGRLDFFSYSSNSLGSKNYCAYHHGRFPLCSLAIFLCPLMFECNSSNLG